MTNYVCMVAWRAIAKGAFQKYFEDWKKRWHKGIVSEGSYFEGDKIVNDI